MLAGCNKLDDAGLSSICWDVYTGRKEEPNLFTLTKQIRATAKQKDPESTFSGEALNNLELESEALDYTWNWVPGYVDYRAFNSLPFAAAQRQRQSFRGQGIVGVHGQPLHQRHAPQDSLWRQRAGRSRSTRSSTSD